MTARRLLVLPLLLCACGGPYDPGGARFPDGEQTYDAGGTSADPADGGPDGGYGTLGGGVANDAGVDRFPLGSYDVCDAGENSAFSEEIVHMEGHAPGVALPMTWRGESSIVFDPRGFDYLSPDNVFNWHVYLADIHGWPGEYHTINRVLPYDMDLVFSGIYCPEGQGYGELFNFPPIAISNKRGLFSFICPPDTKVVGCYRFR